MVRLSFDGMVVPRNYVDLSREYLLRKASKEKKGLQLLFFVVGLFWHVVGLRGWCHIEENMRFFNFFIFILQVY